MYLRKFVGALFIAGIIQLCRTEFEPAYLRVCGKDHKHSVESNQCNKGVWLRKSLEPGCVCVRGVWALTNGFCDRKAVIVVGDGNCFHIGFEIRSAKLIGDPKDPFRPKVYVAPKSLDAFYEVKENSYTPPMSSDETLVIGVNPRQVAQRKDFTYCVDLEPEEYTKPVHIFVNPRRSPKEWTLDQKKTFKCPILTSYHYHIGFGEMFSEDKVEPKLLVERNCKQDCPVSVKPQGRSVSMMGRSAANGTILPVQPQNRQISTLKIGSLPDAAVFSTNPKIKSKPLKTMEERNREREELRARVTQVKENYEKETNEQTLRMMHAHISPLLLSLPGKLVSTREYQYFQQIRRVVERACPEEYVPKLLLRGLMRMFRQLLWETQDDFTHSQSNDDSQFNRTLDILDYCANTTLDPSVIFTTYTDSYKNDSTLPPAPGPERCPTPMIYSVNGTEYNITDYNTENKYIRNISTFEPHLKFNASQVDFVIETAWKITVIGHYRCSRYFNDTNAADFSHFFHQVQSFFNPKIMKRWFYEKSIQSTYSIVKMVFPSFDLKKFMFGLDTCFFGTQGFSYFDYSNVWLQRPKTPLNPNDVELKKFILPGATSVLTTLDYSPFPAVVPNPPVTAAKKTARRKRSAVEDNYYMWDDNARCLESYMEPVRRNDLGYHLPTGCVLPTPF